jgi:phosphoglycerol transferase
VRVGSAIAALALLAVGLYDQTFPRLKVSSQQVRRAFQTDREFVRAVEQSLPEGAAVFQLPYVPYPESVPVGEINHYVPSVGYLHSERLRWSYAATKGRPTAERNADAASAPAEQLVPHLVLQGFTAVWLDRWGYPNRRPPVEGGLAALADGPPLVSPDERYAVFAFTRYRDALTNRLAAGERPLVVVSRGWTNGFFPAETNPGGNPELWRWCGAAQGVFTLNNPAGYPQRVRITFSAGSYKAGDWHLTLDGLGLSETTPISVAMTRVERVVVVPPGTHTVRLACDATPSTIGGRTLVFRVADDSFQTLPDGGK